MSGFFRLAVIKTGNGPLAVVEHKGNLLPLADVLVGPDAPALGDLMPCLVDWDRYVAEIGAFVDTNHALFAVGMSASAAQFLPPVAAPGKIVCIGSNYHDHIAEMSIPMVPSYPYSFLKPANNTLRGSGEPVQVPRRTKMMDWEAELAVIIGRTCHDVVAADALDYVAGYANLNDLSARDWLADRPPIGVDWVQHKAFDGFAPVGPYIVPARFVPDPQNLPVRLTVNGVSKQASNTGQMVFGVTAIIEHLSSIMTLHPGDIIATGTPAGVGHGRKPPEYLKAGDEIRVEIGPFGELVTPVI